MLPRGAPTSHRPVYNHHQIANQLQNWCCMTHIGIPIFYKSGTPYAHIIYIQGVYWYIFDICNINRVILYLYICLSHLFAYWLEQMRHIEEHIQPRLSLSLSSTCHLPGDKGKEGLWLINNLPANSYPPVNWGNTGEKQVPNSGWLWPMMNWHFLFLFLNSMSVVDQL